MRWNRGEFEELIPDILLKAGDRINIIILSKWYIFIDFCESRSMVFFG